MSIYKATIFVACRLVIAGASGDVDSSTFCEGQACLGHSAHSLIQQQHRSSIAGLVGSTSLEYANEDGDGRSSSLPLMQLHNEIKSRVVSKQPPAGIKGYIKDELLPQADQTRLQLQGEVDRSADAIRSCHNSAQADEKQVRELETALMAEETKHKECREIEDENRKIELEKCGELEGYASSLGSPQPDLESVLYQSTTIIEDALRRAKEFYDDHYPSFMEKKEQCTKSKESVAAQSGKCKADKAGIETSYCKIQGQRQKTCEAYGECYENKASHFDKVVGHVKLLEAHTKETFKTLSCFHEGMGENADDCLEGSIDTSHLDVSYPMKPRKEECSGTVKTDEEYTTIRCPGDPVILPPVPDGAAINVPINATFGSEDAEAPTGSETLESEEVVATTVENTTSITTGAPDTTTLEQKNGSSNGTIANTATTDSEETSESPEAGANDDDTPAAADKDNVSATADEDVQQAGNSSSGGD